ncbi:MAG: cellulose biosynthesis protein BcsS [Alphaproteobacteria bacterium]|nr:cellulose biosynthesis protein BcsS [Alphaproteobacteria bacterium]
MRHTKLKLAASAAALLCFATAANADVFPNSGAKAPQGVVFGAANMGDDTTYAVIGAVHAINANMNSNGFLVHGAVELLNYDYLSGATTISADGWGASIMAGYQFMFSNAGKIALYAGVGHRDIDTTPNDPLSETNGQNTAFKGQVEAYYGVGEMVDLSALANYFDSAGSYYGRARAGFHLGGVVVGPEIALHGSDEYDTREYGAFIRYTATDTVAIGAKVGYADRDGNRNDDGAYFGIEIGLGY